MSIHLTVRVVSICLIATLVIPTMASFGVHAEAYSGVTPTVIYSGDPDDFAISRDGDWIAFAEQNTDVIHIRELEGPGESIITLQNGILFYGDRSSIEYSSDDEWLFISYGTYCRARMELIGIHVCHYD